MCDSCVELTDRLFYSMFKLNTSCTIMVLTITSLTEDRLITCQDALWKNLSTSYPYNTPPFVERHYTVNVTITMMLIALLDLVSAS